MKRIIALLLATLLCVSPVYAETVNTSLNDTLLAAGLDMSATEQATERNSITWKSDPALDYWKIEYENTVYSTVTTLEKHELFELLESLLKTYSFEIVLFSDSTNAKIAVLSYMPSGWNADISKENFNDMNEFLTKLHPMISMTTIPVNVIGFCELYMQRITEYALNYDLSIDYGSKSTLVYSTDKSGHSGHTTGGIVSFDPDTLEITEVTTVFQHIGSSDQEILNDLCKAAATFCALEYDWHEDQSVAIKHKNNPALPATLIDKAIVILDDAITKITDENHDLFNQLMDGERVLVYKGNYAYYLTMSTYASSNTLYLHAEPY